MTNFIQISLKIIFFSLIMLFNEIAAENAEKLTQEQSHEMKMADLAKLVGKPFVNEDEKRSFRIDGINSSGETIGVAYFTPSNPERFYEFVAWYWSPKSGFQIIASRPELQEFYGKDSNLPFKFFKLIINESGAVAGSFLIDKNQSIQRDWQCPWFWWSPVEGLHLSALSDGYQLVKGLNNSGHALICLKKEAAFVKDLLDEEYTRFIQYPNREMIEKSIMELLPLGPEDRIQDFEFKSIVLDATSIDESSNVKGTGTIVIMHNYGVAAKCFKVFVNFEAFEKLEAFYVSEIKNLYSGKIIYKLENL